ncbi:hypothetical protein T08_7876 [Trichinella sp. T8]|nr:hypothetical protein T08_7876 [Trichinella sp. T8]
MIFEFHAFCNPIFYFSFDYCCVHVSTVISHVSQQFRFLQWVVSVQWNYFYKLEYLSLMVVQVSLNGLKRCTKILCFNIIETFWNSCCSCQHGMYYIINIELVHTPALIRNHVDKYIITKHYYQLMPLSLATFQCKSKSKKTRKLWGKSAPGIASGYAPGQIKICIFPQATPKAFYCTIFDLRGFLCKFLIALGPRRRLRLCPRANKNLHIPAGYAQSILLHSYSHGIPSALAYLILEFHTYLFSTYIIYHLA